MKHKLIVHYTAAGKAVSDFALESEYQNLLVQLEQRGVNVAYSTEPIFTRIRVGILQGDLTHDQVKFQFKGETITADKDGRIEHWPAGFLDTMDKLFEALLFKGEI